MKIKARGIHAPRTLANISKFLLIRRETSKTSMKTAKETNTIADCRGMV